MSDFLPLHELQHPKLLCPSLSPGVCWNHVHWVSEAIQPSYPLSLPSPFAFNLSWHERFFQCFSNFSKIFQLFASDGQSIAVSPSASVLPMNIQDWFPLGMIGLISLQSKELSRVFSNTKVQKHQLFSTQLSLWSNSHIHTWLLKKPELWLHGPLWQSNVSAF